MSLDLDYITLEEDLDTVLALESRGVGLNNPAIQSIRKRWCVDAQVARESRERTQTTSSTLYQMYHEVVGLFSNRYHDAVRVMTKNAEKIDEHVVKMEGWMKRTSHFTAKEVPSAGWCARVCYEDVPDLKECIKLANSANGLEAAVKQYTIVTSQMVLDPGKIKRKVEDGELKVIGYSTAAAVHRASGILGRFGEEDVQARPMAGNVYVVTYGEGEKAKLDFGVGNGGNYRDTVAALTESECRQALAAAKKIAKALRDRGAKNGIFGYSGIYEEVEKMKAQLKDMHGDELRVATRRYKNALKLEDAFTTALDRVADGLISWVGATLKANQ